MDVSIIIVSWNTKALLQQCLQSVYETAAKRTFEVLVVDNASSDGSPEMVKKEFPHVKLICTGDNLGFAKANNIGIKKSNGRYVCLVNSDIVILDGCIDKMCSYMDRRPSIGILGPRILNPDLTLQPSCKGFPSHWNTFCHALALDTMFPRSRLFGGFLMKFWPHDAIQSVDIIVGCFWMVRREALNDVSLFDEKFFMFWEDIDLCKRLWIAGWEVVFFPYAESVHHGGASYATAPIQSQITRLCSSAQYFKKYHSRYSQICFLLILFLHQMNRIIGYAFISLFFRSKRKEAILKIKRSIAGIRWIFNRSGLK
jgi:hypothetical protein